MGQQYSSPDDGTVYKIVSIEGTDGGLDLADYYYQNGQPNFVFTREDTVYTPTYATTEKVGERYYFNSDVMVRWRMIRNPGEIGEYTLAPEEVWYSQADYFAESDEVKGIYDDAELRMLNAARNTYDAITGGESIGMVQGILKDTTGAGIGGKKVCLRRASDDALLYEAVTEEDGEYAFFVYLDDTDCYLKVEADDAYKETVVQGIRLSPASVTYTYGLTMHRDSGDEYQAAFRLYSCMDVVSDENGTATGEAIRTASVTIREGAGNYDGEALMTAETENGELTANLPSGVYTVQFHTEGYLDSYTEVEVMEEGVSTDVYVMPAMAENQTGVVLTWDSEDVDLDLTLFTPDQAEGGDMARIGGSVGQDGKGNMLVSDNSSRCEVMFVNSGIQGSYKLYVNDYTDSVAGSYASDALYRVNVHVYIYNSDGFVAEYTVPVGQNGVVWEVAEINGKNVTPAQRVYSEISGKSWWMQDKSVWSDEEDARLKEVLNNEEGELRELLEILSHDFSDECASEKTICALLQGEKEGIEYFLHIGDVGEKTITSGQYLDYFYENQPENGEDLSLKVGGFSGQYCFYTKEQADYLLSSICGKQIDYDFSAYDEWMEPYIVMDVLGDWGDIYNYLDNISVERIRANMWKVRAYHFCGSMSDPEIASSQIYFTIVRNPNSCFDGYSVTDIGVEKKADTAEWAKIYYDYLTTDPEGISIMEAGYGADYWNEGQYNYNLIYVDDDLVPELYLEGITMADGNVLLVISDGKVIKENFSRDIEEYIPYTGLIYDGNVHMGYFYEYNYRLENGTLEELCGHSSYLNENNIIENEKYYSDCEEENEITKEQYDEILNSYAGSGEWQSCIPESSYFDILDALKDLMG